MKKLFIALLALLLLTAMPLLAPPQEDYATPLQPALMPQAARNPAAAIALSGKEAAPGAYGIAEAHTLLLRNPYRAAVIVVKAQTLPHRSRVQSLVHYNLTMKLRTKRRVGLYDSWYYKSMV